MIRPDFEDTDAVVVVSTPSNAGGSTCPSDNLLGAGGAPGAVTSARSLQLNRRGSLQVVLVSVAVAYS